MTTSDQKAHEDKVQADPGSTERKSEVESLRGDLAALESFAVSLQSEITRLTWENRRLRQAAEEMRAESLVLNQFMEQLHAASEQMETYRNKLALAEKKLAVAETRLASAYSSRSWRLTAPLRWCDDVQRRFAKRIRKGDH